MLDRIDRLSLYAIGAFMVLVGILQLFEHGFPAGGIAVFGGYTSIRLANLLGRKE